MCSEVKLEDFGRASDVWKRVSFQGFRHGDSGDREPCSLIGQGIGGSCGDGRGNECCCI